jgi:hypothetical protein
VKYFTLEGESPLAIDLPAPSNSVNVDPPSFSTAGDVNGDGFSDLVVGFPYAGLGAVGLNGSQYYGSVSQALGWLAAARGRTAAALEHFQRAHEMHMALRSPPLSARTQRAIDELRPGRRATRRIS